MVQPFSASGDIWGADHARPQNTSDLSIIRTPVAVSHHSLKGLRKPNGPSWKRLLHHYPLQVKSFPPTIVIIHNQHQLTSINSHFARLFHAFPMFSLGFSCLFLGISQPINPHALHRSPHQRLLGLLQLRCGAGDFEGALHLQHFDLGAGDLRHRSPTGTGERVCSSGDRILTIVQ